MVETSLPKKPSDSEIMEVPPKPARLVSLDAYRGFIMLMMASSAFAFASTLRSHPEIAAQYDGTAYATAWKQLWNTLSYQFGHVEWTGCSFWDLIQPSFMFMVGVAMPYSYSRRSMEGQSKLRLFAHVLFRSLLLILLGVFLSSNSSKQTNFTFVNVLTQIGLGYTFLYLLLGRRFGIQLVAVFAILGGYWFYFYQYTIPENSQFTVTRYLTEKNNKDEAEWTQFSGLAAHWNKHTNAAAEFDRSFLNQFPRDGELFPPEEDAPVRQKFWVNNGGYQTLNFIPSLATMIFGLMAGTMLRTERGPYQKLKWLLLAGLICFVTAMAVDTTIWPIYIDGWNWSLCPAVKRIWTPSWAVFSSGWTFWMLGAFYWVFDILGCKRLAFPLVVVGMNSIAMYCMSQLIKPWTGKTLHTHLATLDAWCGCEYGITYYLFSSDYTYARIGEYTARLFVLWLVCLWMYRKKIFIRI